MFKQPASRKMLTALVGTALAATIFACSGGGPNQVNPGGPLAAPGLGQNPNSVGAGAPPPAGNGGTTVQLNDPANFPFVDGTSEGGRASDRFFTGDWGLNGQYLAQKQGRTIASLSFLQYNGGGFGSTGGVAPARYRADVSVWVYQRNNEHPNMVGAPLGVLGYAPYFINETRYLLVVAKPTNLEVWAVDGQVPGTEWPLTNRLFSQPLAEPLDIAKPVSWAVEVDTNANSATVWANGEQKAVVKHPMLTNAGQRVALVSNGNYLHFQDFKVFRL